MKTARRRSGSFSAPVLCAALAAAPVQAEDAEALAACVASSSAAAEVCVGAMTEACMARGDAATALDMNACIMGEAAAWERVVDDGFGALLARARASDAAQPGDDPAWKEEAGALEGAQQAWGHYRTAQCGYAYHKWHDGSMRNTEAALCLRDTAAARAVFLLRELDPDAAAKGTIWR